MVKAKAKADRATSRHATVPPLHALSSMVPLDSLQHVHLGQNEGTQESDTQTQDADEPSNPASMTDPVAVRMELLRSKPEVVGRFMQLIVPVLVDVYAASVITPIRIKTLTGLLKAVGFLEGDDLRAALNVSNVITVVPSTYSFYTQMVPVASFASSILSSKDHPSLVIGALQLVDLLLQKVPADYRPVLRREGVFHEIEAFALRTLSTAKTKDKDTSDATASMHSPPVSLHISSSIPGYKKIHSLSLEPEDAITLRARVIRFKYALGQEESDGDKSFDEFRRLVTKLSAPDATEQVMVSGLRDLAEHFTSNAPVSSFELLQSGAVEGLLRFATEKGVVPMKRRHELLFEAFTKTPRGDNSSHSPFAILVKKLQESLTRMENFEVIAIAQGSDDSKRSSPSLLARQLRLRLVTDDDSDIPRSLQNMVVSIHAIATFQALNDYLRPRVAGVLSSGRLSNMLAALAASGFGPRVTSRAAHEADGQTSHAIETLSAPTSSDTPAPFNEVQRRRSQRLSAKNGSSGSADATVDSMSTTPAPPQSSSSRREETILNDTGFTAEFTDDDVDAEVSDDPFC